jgi:uncharacterized membrane protein YbhN (UPF0104 family)
VAKSVRRKTVLRALLSASGLLLFALLVYLADPRSVVAALSLADPVWLAAMLLALVAAAVIGAINSYMMIRAPGPELGFRSYLGAYWCAWALGQVVPGQIGDLVGISLYLRRRGLALPTAIGRLGVDKMISLFCTLAFSGGLILIYDSPVARFAGLLGIGLAAVLLVAYMLSRPWNGAAESGVGLWGHLLSAMREAQIVIANKPGVVLLNTLLTVLKLLVIGVCYWTALRALNASPGGIVKVAITANSAGLIAYVPLSANGLGTVEAGGVYLFGLSGLAAPVVIASYLVLRVANLTLAWIGTALVLLKGAFGNRHVAL